MIKKGIAMLLTITILMMPLTVQAKETTRYTTQKVALRKNHKTILTVKRNTKLKVLRHGTKWSKVKYKGKTYLCRKKFLNKYRSPKKYTGAEFRQAGVIWYRGYKYTWYSQRILPGYGLKIPGRHLDSQGFVCDKWGYIVLGSNTANRGKIVCTPFGRYGKVYDAGYVGTYWFDCYTDW